MEQIIAPISPVVKISILPAKVLHCNLVLKNSGYQIVVDGQRCRLFSTAMLKFIPGSRISFTHN